MALHLTLSLWRNLYTPSSHLALTTVTLCWPCRQCPPLTSWVWQVMLWDSTRKFDHRLTQLCHCRLHCLDIPVHIKYMLGVTIQRSIQSRAPQYLVDYCTPTSDVASSHRLHCVSRYQLIVPRHRHSKFGRRAFSVVSPITWNCLPDNLHDPMLSDDKFRAALKTHFSASTRTCSTLEASCVIALYKCIITDLLCTSHAWHRGTCGKEMKLVSQASVSELYVQLSLWWCADMSKTLVVSVKYREQCWSCWTSSTALIQRVT